MSVSSLEGGRNISADNSGLYWKKMNELIELVDFLNLCPFPIVSVTDKLKNIEQKLIGWIGWFDVYLVILISSLDCFRTTPHLSNINQITFQILKRWKSYHTLHLISHITSWRDENHITYYISYLISHLEEIKITSQISFHITSQISYQIWKTSPSSGNSSKLEVTILSHQ